MKEVIDFLKEIRVNNNREWFQLNKARYKEIERTIDGLASQLINGISAFDPAVAGLSAKDCTYRIYRDVRFSLNKDPFKTHIGIYVCPKGKKSDFAGYYLHIEPGSEGQLPCHLLSAGIYMPEKDILRSVREEIEDNGESLLKETKKARGFHLDESNKLKRLPMGFTAGSPYDEYLKLKDICLMRELNDDYLLADRLAERVAADFKTTYGFMRILNRAVEYALEMRGQNL